MAMVGGRENKLWKQKRCKVVPKLLIDAFTKITAFGKSSNTFYNAKVWGGASEGILWYYADIKKMLNSNFQFVIIKYIKLYNY